METLSLLLGGDFALAFGWRFCPCFWVEILSLLLGGDFALAFGWRFCPCFWVEILPLLLGGAALQRCGKRFVLIAPLGAEVVLFAAEAFFPAASCC
jgi:hypothetical protein